MTVNNYSYAEMQNMQRRAMERVQVMRKKSEDLVGGSQYASETTPKKEDFGKSGTAVPVKTKITNMPPNFPQEKYPTFKEYFDEEKNIRQKENIRQQPVSDLVDSLLNEPDKAILMGLIMLLRAEEADELLIMALMYIMS